MTPERTHAAVLDRLAAWPDRIVSCSGGVDSLLLSDVAHEAAPGTTLIAHSVTPAVPRAATERVLRASRERGWSLRLVRSTEFSDERYLANPVDRCYHCKTHLYDELGALAAARPGATVLSGANVDDLGEYRPGLEAARAHGVRHPWLDAGVTKDGIRALALARGRDWHDLPAAPCLASRLYTGTAVTPELLRAVEAGERRLRELTGLAVVRCRIRGAQARIEVGADGRDRVTPDVVADVGAVVRAAAPGVPDTVLDAEPYAPGRAFVRLEPPRSR